MSQMIGLKFPFSLDRCAGPSCSVTTKLQPIFPWSRGSSISKFLPKHKHQGGEAGGERQS